MYWDCSSPLLTKQQVNVTCSGEVVRLHIGNASIAMHYEQALALSAMIRREAKAIKRAIGRAKTIRCLGTLEDLDARPRPIPYSPGTAIHVKTPLEKFNSQQVGSEGRLVRVQIGNNTIRTHFENALKISQWLRLKAKECQRIAGDTERPWYTIAVVE